MCEQAGERDGQVNEIIKILAQQKNGQDPEAGAVGQEVKTGTLLVCSAAVLLLVVFAN